MNEWQPIETADLEEQATAIVFNGQVFEARWQWLPARATFGWTDQFGQRVYPTHWMPLPEPPEVKP